MTIEEAKTLANYSIQHLGNSPEQFEEMTDEQLIRWAERCDDGGKDE